MTDQQKSAPAAEKDSAADQFLELSRLIGRSVQGLSEADKRQRSRRVDALQKELTTKWANKYGLARHSGAQEWPRLIDGRRFRAEPITWSLPGDDHVSLWQWKGYSKPVAWVSQPYGLDDEQLAAMSAHAIRCGLKFSVDTWPAWHFPGRVLFVTWTAKETELWRGR